LHRLSQADIPVFLLVGNHDLPHALGRASALDIYGVLQVPQVTVGDRLTTYRWRLETGRFRWWRCPGPGAVCCSAAMRYGACLSTR
jgi:exonuclease SbcD